MTLMKRPLIQKIFNLSESVQVCEHKKIEGKQVL